MGCRPFFVKGSFHFRDLSAKLSFCLCIRVPGILQISVGGYKYVLMKSVLENCCENIDLLLYEAADS